MNDFKKFILRGNVLDLAIGIIIGASFNSVVSALVKDLLTPFISAIIKVPNFSNYSFTINHSQFLYGDFFNALISFIIEAIAVYFFIVLPFTKFLERMHLAPKPTPAPQTKKCPECQMDIPLLAKRCPNCTSTLTTGSVS